MTLRKKKDVFHPREKKTDSANTNDPEQSLRLCVLNFNRARQYSDAIKIHTTTTTKKTKEKEKKTIARDEPTARSNLAWNVDTAPEFFFTLPSTGNVQ